MMDNPYIISGEHIADRLMRQQTLQEGSLPLHGDPPPTKRQVAAVLHALADPTLDQHMLGPAVLALGDDRRKAIWEGPSAPNRQERRAWALGIGIERMFHGVGDELEEQAFRDDEREAAFQRHRHEVLSQEPEEE